MLNARFVDVRRATYQKNYRLAGSTGVGSGTTLSAGGDGLTIR
jgi:tetrahydromethanopterin S-methyltransferase subunit D